MFFEATYLPSPQFSSASQDDMTIPDMLSPMEESLPPPKLEEKQEDERPEDNSDLEQTPVNHLVFVIHGIGQQTEQYGHFHEHVESLQETTRQVLQAKVPDHNVRIELIPIEWHRHIHDQVDPILKKITLKSIPTIRLIENDYLADVLFYFSKDRGQSIIDNVTHLFNTSYHNFMEKHPDFDGKIIILGYSLGGILTWDILSHQREPTTAEETIDYNKLDVIYRRLDFKPDFFFTLGSPIAAVLTFRNQSPVTYHPDEGVVFENLFHPFDPLAYRMEPLYHDYYTDQPAILVERSAPPGPSFSFPSLPSLPGMGLFSYFSWKMSSSSSSSSSTSRENNINDTNINNNTIDADSSTIDNNTAPPPLADNSKIDNDRFIFKDKRLSVPLITESGTSDQASDRDVERKGSIMHSFLQYFGKGRRDSKDDVHQQQQGHQQQQQQLGQQLGQQEEQQVTAHPSASKIIPISSDSDKRDQGVNREQVHGIITWDPLEEQQRKYRGRAVLSTDSFVNSHVPKQKPISEKGQSFLETLPRRPLQRSKTYCAQESFNAATNPVFIYEIDKGLFTDENAFFINDFNYMNQSSSLDNNSHAAQDGTQGNKKALRHLVEVLGIDGVRMDSVERAKENFPRTKNNSISQQQQRQKQRQEANQLETMQEQTESSVDTTNNRDTKLEDKMDKTKEVIREGVTAYTTTPADKSSSSTDHLTIVESDQDIKRQEEHPKMESGTRHDNGETVNEGDDNDTKREEARAKEALNCLPGNRRMDFALQPDGFMSMIANEYIVGLRAHFSYWTSKDLMWHILQILEKESIATSTNQHATS